jgi:hypothetical protein
VITIMADPPTEPRRSVENVMFHLESPEDT